MDRFAALVWTLGTGRTVLTAAVGEKHSEMFVVSCLCWTVRTCPVQGDSRDHQTQNIDILKNHLLSKVNIASLVNSLKCSSLSIECIICRDRDQNNTGLNIIYFITTTYNINC